METMLAKHCAPVLFGKKPAALLASRAVPEEYRRENLSRYGLRVERLISQNRPPLFLLYRPELLRQTLAQVPVRQALLNFGYPETRPEEWRALLNTLRHRFRESDEFPHEVGLFLGYPVGDVMGFVTCKGKDCKLCGLWKVYDDVEKAKRRFAEFEYLKKVLSDFVKGGGSIRSGNLSNLVS
jgi:hypothetical protein